MYKNEKWSRIKSVLGSEDYRKKKWQAKRVTDLFGELPGLGLTIYTVCGCVAAWVN